MLNTFFSTTLQGFFTGISMRRGKNVSKLRFIVKMEPCPRCLKRPMFYQSLFGNQINARDLISQSAMVIVPVNSWKNRASPELFYKSNRLRFYGL